MHTCIHATRSATLILHLDTDLAKVLAIRHVLVCLLEIGKVKGLLVSSQLGRSRRDRKTMIVDLPVWNSPCQ